MSTSTWRLHVCCFSSVRRQRSEAPWISDLPAYCACTTSCFTPRRSSWCPSSCLAKRNRSCTSLSTRSAGITARILSLGTGQRTEVSVHLTAVLDAVEKRNVFAPARNRTPIPRPSSPQPDHYTDWATLAPVSLTWCCNPHSTNAIRSYVAALTLLTETNTNKILKQTSSFGLNSPKAYCNKGKGKYKRLITEGQ